MRATKTRLWTLVLLGLFGSAAACTSRTVPLPPPTVEPLSLPDEDGFVTVRGRAHENASVGVLNEASEEGVVVSPYETGCESTCAFEAQIRAAVGDSIRVWQFFETESSRHLEVPRD